MVEPKKAVICMAITQPIVSSPYEISQMWLHKELHWKPIDIIPSMTVEFKQTNESSG